MPGRLSQSIGYVRSTVKAWDCGCIEKDRTVRSTNIRKSESSDGLAVVQGVSNVEDAM